MAKSKNPIEDLVSRANKFVEKQKGRWDHDAWKKLLNDVSKTGVEMSDDTRRHLGNMLESMKHFYVELSNTPKADAAKPKPKKAGEKTKSATKKKKTDDKKPAKKKAAKKKSNPKI